MKTIAVTIDEKTLKGLDRLAESRSRGKRLGRSEIVRRAFVEYLAQREREEREQNDRQVIARNKDRLARAAHALVADQAKP